MIDLVHMKMYVDVMNVMVGNVNEKVHWNYSNDFLFDLIEMMERFVKQANSMLYHMNDVEHDGKMIND
jgi:hypothetical protein